MISRYPALQSRDFVRFLVGKTASDIGTQMQTLAVGWEIHERVADPEYLGYVGLAQILPVLLLAIPAGQVADLLDRRKILLGSQLVLAAASLGLVVASTLHLGLPWIYGFLFLSGVGRAFQQPARSALVPSLVPAEHFPNAVTINVTVFQLAAAIGPGVGGYLLHLWKNARPVYALDALSALGFLVCLLGVRSPPPAPSRSSPSLRSLAGGLAFVHRTKVLLGALTLDMLAVLLGGAVALLPIYAKDILRVGEAGLGWLRAAPSFGALTTFLILSLRPPLEKNGRALLICVAGFGAATIVFGVSESYPLSLAMLFLTGAFDMVSVIIRHTLVQTLTPDELRGRVSAVNGLFIGISNELGVLESGLAAKFLGTVPSVVFGGAGTIGVVLLVLVLWPEVGRFGRLMGTHSSRKSEP